MVYLYSGTPGSGKSLHTARVIYHTLMFGLPVIANFPIAFEKIKTRRSLGQFVEYSNDVLCPGILIQFAREYWREHGGIVKEGKLLLVIDECQLIFNAREWNVKGRGEWLSFFTQHRKYGYDIILVAQFDRMIDRQIRSLIEYEQIHRKVSNFGIKGQIINFLALGNLFVSVKVWYPMKEKVGSEFFKARKRYYSLYDTYAMFGAGEDGEQGAPAEHAPDMGEEVS